MEEGRMTKWKGGAGDVRGQGGVMVEFCVREREREREGVENGRGKDDEVGGRVKQERSEVREGWRKWWSFV